MGKTKVLAHAHGIIWHGARNQARHADAGPLALAGLRETSQTILKDAQDGFLSQWRVVLVRGKGLLPAGEGERMHINGGD